MFLLGYLSAKAIWIITASCMGLLVLLAVPVWKLDRSFALLTLDEQERFSYQNKLWAAAQPLLLRAATVILVLLGVALIMAPAKTFEFVRMIKTSAVWSHAAWVVAAFSVSMFVVLPMFWHWRCWWQEKSPSSIRTRHFLTVWLLSTILFVILVIIGLALWEQT